MKKKPKQPTAHERISELRERVYKLEAHAKWLEESFRLLVDAHNRHTHSIEWPRVMTIVLGPRCTQVNLKAPEIK